MPARDTKLPSAFRRARIAINCVLAIAVVYVVSLIAGNAVDSANTGAQVRIVSHEAEILYDAFQTYYERNGSYPATYSGARFDPETLDPLRRRGYYRGPIIHNLIDQRVDAYDSPDDRGENREFWLELSLRRDPGIRFLVARSDDAPSGGGQWREGVFVYRNGSLEKL